MRNDSTSVARRHLDARVSSSALISTLQRPPRGWIRAIREALGMTTTQLAKRLGVSQPAVVSLERSEALGHVRLDTLQRAAAALDCTLVYTLVPNQPLESLVQSRRREIAEKQLAAVEQSMALENQSVTDRGTQEHLLDELASRIDAQTLWNEL